MAGDGERRLIEVRKSDHVEICAKEDLGVGYSVRML